MGPIVLYEHENKALSEIGVPVFSEVFLDYKLKSGQKAIGSFTKRKIRIVEGDLCNDGSNVGIISIHKDIPQIEFRPKLDSEKYTDTEERNDKFWHYLPRMLEVLSDYKGFNNRIFIDPSRIIQLPKGCNLVPLFALSFVSLLDKALQQGIYKKYIKKNNRLKAIKGKIDFSMLSKEKAWDASSIPCNYYDLTFNNNENQIILWCLGKLLGKIKEISDDDKKSNVYIVKRMREQESLLSQEVSLLPKTSSDLLKTDYSAMPRYYLPLMNLCKVILNEKMFAFEKEGRGIEGVNFVIDMDWVFEQYMTHLFKEVEKEGQIEGLSVDSQKSKGLCDQNRVKIKPDIIINLGGAPVAVIDFKWKYSGDVGSPQYYQVICYALADLQNVGVNKQDACLFSVGDMAQGRYINQIDTISTVFDGKKQISIIKLDLNPELLLGSDNDEVEKSIKKQILEYLESLKTGNAP